MPGVLRPFEKAGCPRVPPDRWLRAMRRGCRGFELVHDLDAHDDPVGNCRTPVYQDDTVMDCSVIRHGSTCREQRDRQADVNYSSSRSRRVPAITSHRQLAHWQAMVQVVLPAYLQRPGTISKPIATISTNAPGSGTEAKLPAPATEVAPNRDFQNAKSAASTVPGVMPPSFCS